MVHTKPKIPGSNIEFHRAGGKFVTYRTAIFLVIMFLSILVVVFFLGRFSLAELYKLADDASVLLQLVDPFHYSLLIKPILDNTNITSERFTFSGQVDILIRIEEDTKEIQLNSRRLNILTDRTMLRRVTDPEERPHFENMMEADLLQNIELWKSVTENVVSIRYQEILIANEKFTIYTIDPLLAGSVHLLSIHFKGKIDEEAIGLYRTKYIDGDNKLRWIINTKFEPNNARQMFPCFDEIDHKALFSITAYQPKGYRAFSNMAIKSKYMDEDSDAEIIEFNTTPRLPTYLIAFILTENFLSHSSQDKQNIWVRSNLSPETTAITHIIPRLFSYFRVLFSDNLPLDEIDFVGIPDASARGMESFGMITMEENNFLYNPLNYSIKQFETMTLSVGFLIAQQWFSNMITPRSWSLFWLRESFAKYFSYMGLKEISKINYFSSSFLVNEMRDVMHADSMSDSEPLFQISLKTPKHIRLFNQKIVRKKGGCLIRMLEHFIGIINFRHALKEYIKKWYLKSISSVDVWDSFDDSINNLKMYHFNVSVKQVMQSWTRNKGYPLVSIQINRKAGTAKFKQEPFSLSKEDREGIWYIPISYTTQEEYNFNSTKPRFWLTSQSPVTVSLNKSNSLSTWIMANIDQTGYYRVNYDIATWDVLLSHLHGNYYSIPEKSRYQLLDDAFALAYGGYIQYNIPLGLAALCAQNENHILLWEGTLRQLTFMKGIFPDEQSKEIFRQFVLKLLKRIAHYLNYENGGGDKSDREYFKYIVNKESCRYDHKGCVQWANAHFNGSIDNEEMNTEKVLGDLKGVLYSVVARQDKYEDWLHFFEKIKDPKVDPIEKIYLAQGLASTNNITAIDYMLSYISYTDDSAVHKTTKVEIWIQLAQHLQNLDTFLVLIRKYWEPTYLKLQSHADLLHKFVDNIGVYLGTKKHLKSVYELRNYHFSICTPEDKMLFNHLITEIELKISLQESHLQQILGCFNNYLRGSIEY